VKEPVWVTREAVLAIHEELLKRFGGAAGVRDEGMLESALHRPVNLFRYADPSLHALAAAYAAGVVKNHPFVDGNKRAGFMAAYVFLGINGQQLAAPEEEAVLRTLALAAGELSEDAYAAWLAASCVAQTEEGA
jgi:death on curing protein